MIDVFIKIFFTAAIIFDAFIGWYILSKGVRKPQNQTYFFMMFLIFMWQCSNYATSYFNYHSPYVHQFLGFLAFASMPYILVSMLYFVYIYQQEKHNYRLLIGLVLSTITCVVPTLMGWVISYKGNPLLEKTFSFEWFYPVYVTYTSIMLLGIVTALIYCILHTTDVQLKKNNTLILIAFLFPIILGSITNLVIPFIYYNSGSSFSLSASNLGPASTSIMSALIAYAVARYRLLDIKVRLKRNFLRYVLYGIAGLSYTTLIFLLVMQIELKNTIQNILFFTLIFGSFFFFEKCGRGIDNIVNSFFARESIDVYTILNPPESIQKVNSTIENIIMEYKRKIFDQLGYELHSFFVNQEQYYKFQNFYPIGNTHFLSTQNVILHDLKMLRRIYTQHMIKEIQLYDLYKYMNKRAISLYMPIIQNEQLIACVFLKNTERTLPIDGSVAKIFSDLQSEIAQKIATVLQFQRTVENIHFIQ